MVPAVGSSVLKVKLAGQVITGAPAEPVYWTVTVKVHVSPVGAVQVTTVLPTAKVDPEGGLQTTPLLPSSPAPQLPDVVGAA